MLKLPADDDHSEKTITLSVLLSVAVIAVFIVISNRGIAHIINKPPESVQLFGFVALVTSIVGLTGIFTKSLCLLLTISVYISLVMLAFLALNLYVFEANK